MNNSLIIAQIMNTEIVFLQFCKFLERIKSTLHVEVYKFDEMSLGKSNNYLLACANGKFIVHYAYAYIYIHTHTYIHIIRRDYIVRKWRPFYRLVRG